MCGTRTNQFLCKKQRGGVNALWLNNIPHDGEGVVVLADIIYLFIICVEVCIIPPSARSKTTALVTNIFVLFFFSSIY